MDEKTGALVSLRTSAETADWHCREAAAALEALSSGADGLSALEAARRLSAFGPNTLPEGRRAGLVLVFARQFMSPLIYVLLFAGVLSLCLGHAEDSAFVFGVLLLNAFVGAAQEWRAERSAAALRQVLHPSACVMRGGVREDIDAGEVVPGDIVILEPGMGVPADLRLLTAQGLRIDESLLTGESQPVEKSDKTLTDPGAALGSRFNLGFAGTLVLAGRGLGVVAATGVDTQIGHIAHSLAAASAEPPLAIRLKRFARRLGLALLGVVALLAAAQAAQGVPWTDILLFAIALTVAAIPEGLPVAITIALAVAARRLSARNVIVRRLAAVEGLGACTVIASDKTGTLTINRLTIKRLLLADGRALDIGGHGLEVAGDIAPADAGALTDETRAALARLALAGALANEARLDGDGDGAEAFGDTVDIAFLVLARKLDLKRQDLLGAQPVVHTVPYESERRYSASVHRHGDGHVAYLKGAPEAILPRCAGIDIGAVEARVEALAREGYRVLAVAAGPVDIGAGTDELGGSLVQLELLGLAGLIDPVRPEVPEAVERCRQAGIRVCMVTGDHPQTGLAIARQLGIAAEEAEIVTGRELGELTGEALTARVDKARVFARAEPAQKSLIVRELQKLGHFVAVTGDGVNDAPALKAANTGVAMGRAGTDVARAAADLIITDDNFASIVNGVEVGRAAYANIRKVIWLLLSTGVAEVLIFFLALATGLPMPLTAVQILWLNLVTNGLQDVAMAFEGTGAGVMRRPPRRPDEPVLDAKMITQCVLGGVHIAVASFAVYGWMLMSGESLEAARNILLFLMVLFENVQCFNCRSEYRSIFVVPVFRNPILLATVFGAQGLHIAALYMPVLSDVLDAAPITLAQWAGLSAVAMSLIVTGEALKLWRRWAASRPPRAAIAHGAGPAL